MKFQKFLWRMRFIGKFLDNLDRGLWRSWLRIHYFMWPWPAIVSSEADGQNYLVTDSIIHEVDHYEHMVEYLVLKDVNGDPESEKLDYRPMDELRPPK